MAMSHKGPKGPTGPKDARAKFEGKKPEGTQGPNGAEGCTGKVLEGKQPGRTKGANRPEECKGQVPRQADETKRPNPNSATKNLLLENEGTNDNNKKEPKTHTITSKQKTTSLCIVWSCRFETKKKERSRYKQATRYTVCFATAGR